MRDEKRTRTYDDFADFGEQGRLVPRLRLQSAIEQLNLLYFQSRYLNAQMCGKGCWCAWWVP